MVFGFGHRKAYSCLLKDNRSLHLFTLFDRLSRSFCFADDSEDNYNQVYNQPHEGSMTHEALGGEAGCLIQLGHFTDSLA